MSIISKLKGAKKAADDHKAKTDEQDTKPVATIPYKHVPTHAATDAMTSSPGGWKSEEIAYQNKARLSRIGSDYSTRPSTSHTTTTRSNSRPGFNRANSDSSLDFTPASQGFSMPLRSTGSSLKSAAISRNPSYQGLEKVMESNDRDQEPVFAAALLANRTKASRSPRGSTRSSLGKSPLSSVGKFLFMLTTFRQLTHLQNHPPSHHPQRVKIVLLRAQAVSFAIITSFQSTQINLSVGGQIELRSSAVAYASALEIHPGHKVNQMPVEQPQPQRKYFGHNKPPTSETKEASVPAPVIVKKEKRFSFLKRGSSSVAAH
ncbi:unnamed protein product [Aureobasidium vineae]|uniref:Uncharacterized protein n=1 Tax=Aureobasidium vineae TaxID=2773715 RepID=A0A9N8P929_9PEZI|nr:unnamed protein product [Aureobasidium vineae]